MYIYILNENIYIHQDKKKNMYITKRNVLEYNDAYIIQGERKREMQVFLFVNGGVLFGYFVQVVQVLMGT